MTRSTDPSNSSRKCEIGHSSRPRHPLKLPPVSTPDPNPRDFNSDALVNTCRQIRKLLVTAKPPTALRVVAPQIADALPLLQALVMGIEDLADRTRLLEIGRGR